MRTYTTVQGDMWDGIAYTQMGSVAYTDRLMALNPAHLDKYTFPAGVVLTLPDEEIRTVDTLPPWRRVFG